MKIIHNTAFGTTTPPIFPRCSTNRRRHILQIFKHMPFYIWTEHFCSIVMKEPKSASRKQYGLLTHSRFTPTCFSKSFPSSGGRSYLRSYSSNICILDVSLISVIHCWLHPSTTDHAGRIVIHTHP
jgi:hypothetical protein